jgi:hypothetical protein
LATVNRGKISILMPKKRRQNKTRAERGLAPGKQWFVKDLTGKIFGRLIVLERNPENHKHGNARWVVRCLCGTVKTVRSCHLLNGRTISCGCYNEEKKHLKEFSRQSFVRQMRERYKHHAERRGYVWRLTDEQVDLYLSGNCFFCGVEPLWRNRQKGNMGAFLYNGIDRLVNHLGYFPENCVSCCGDCNIAKKDRSVHDFIKWIRRVAEHFDA